MVRFRPIILLRFFLLLILVSLLAFFECWNKFSIPFYLLTFGSSMSLFLEIKYTCLKFQCPGFMSYHFRFSLKCRHVATTQVHLALHSDITLQVADGL